MKIIKNLILLPFGLAIAVLAGMIGLLLIPAALLSGLFGDFVEDLSKE